MNINGLLEFYRKVHVKDEKVELCDRYVRGPASLAPIKGELLYNHIPISPFDMHSIVIYGIVSELNPKSSPKWKLESVKEIFAEGHDSTENGLINYLQRN
ncbi:MAG TPA: hypothetical protein VJJ52_02755 [Candidatus Nanoarchaeia archaeon]|nr:hypothetical protein [Candidatus Nanoarchaeia archaeon]